MRCAAGLVFVTSGVSKLVYENQGAARFAKIGFPGPAALASSIGVIEILCGLLLAFGLLARLAGLLLAADMLVAIAATKLPLLWGGGPEIPAAFPKVGLLGFLYQARLDLTMLAITAVVVFAGAGAASLDARRAAASKRRAVLDVATASVRS